MSYPPPGGSPDPYQPAQPYGQPTSGTPDPYQQYGQQPTSGGAGAFTSNDPYGAPSSGQPYGQQPGYGYGAPYNPTTNVMAILALVFAFVFSPVAIVLGHIAKKQIRERGEQGEGLATAGLVLGYIFTGLGALACVAWVIIVIAAASSGATSP